MHLANPRPSFRGFGLVEVLIALVVLGAGLLALVRMQTELVGAGGTSKQRTEATALCQKKAEELRSFVSLSNYDAYFSAGATVSGSDAPVTGESAVFTISYTLSDIRNDAVKGRHANIEVRCTWSDAQNKAQAVKLDSTIARVSPSSLGYLAQSVLAPEPTSCKADASEEDRQWTVSGATCLGGIMTGGEVGAIANVAASSNSGTNQYVCTSAGTWSEVTGFTKTCSNICPAQIISWNGGNGETCVSDAAIAPKASGSSSTVSDTSLNVTGSATFKCASTGDWELQSGSSCLATCPPTELRWNSADEPADLQLCVAEFGRTTAAGAPWTTNKKQKIVIQASPVEQVKEAEYQCNKAGAWQLVSSKCNLEVPCGGESKEWGTTTPKCISTLPITDSGVTVTVTDATVGATGRASFTCQVGALWSAPSSASCRTNCQMRVTGRRNGGKDKDYTLKYKPKADLSAPYSVMCTNPKDPFDCPNVPIFDGGISYIIAAYKKDKKLGEVLNGVTATITPTCPSAPSQNTYDIDLRSK